LPAICSHSLIQTSEYVVPLVCALVFQGETEKREGGGGLGAGTGAAGPAPSGSHLVPHAGPVQTRSLVSLPPLSLDSVFGSLPHHVHTSPLPELAARLPASRHSSRSQVVHASMAGLVPGLAGRPEDGLGNVAAYSLFVGSKAQSQGPKLATLDPHDRYEHACFLGWRDALWPLGSNATPSRKIL
jgi:hypothetical protein